MKRTFVLLLVMTCVGVAPADTRSHAPVGASAPELKPQELLEQRYKEARVEDVFKNLQKYQTGLNFLDPKNRELLNTPEARRLLRKLIDGDPEYIKLFEQVARSKAQFQNLSSEELQAKLRQAAKQLQPGAASDPGPTPAESAPRVPSLDERELAARKAYAERIGDWLKSMKLDGVEGSLHESPTFRDVMRELSKHAPTTDGRTTTLPSGLASNLEKLENLAGDLRRWLPKNMPKLSGLQLPQGPSLGSPSFAFGSPSFGSWSLPGDGTAALVAVMVVLAALVAWKWRRRDGRESVAALNAYVLEPVDPDTVSTREQLIRAFEYLALTRFGWDARHWHHRRVGLQFATVADGSDAEALARLYEQARYAPRTDADWTAARPLLRRLAEPGG